MSVDEVLRKLGPLIPAQVKEWRRSLPLLDAETRRDLEQHIIATAQDLLGEWEERMLLPPPFRDKAAGSLKLGTVLYDRPLHPFGLKPEELLQGLGIYGRSGAGKTNVVFSLIKQLERAGIKFLFLDWKRTCRHLLPFLRNRVGVYTPGRSLSPFFFNPLIPPPGMELRTHITQLIDILSDAYTLGDGAKSLLQEVLAQVYEEQEAWPTFDQVRQALGSREVQGRAIGWKASAMRALQGVTFSEVAGGAAVNQEQLVASFLRQSTVIELNGLDESTKKFLVPSLLRWLFHYRIQTPDREKLKLVIIVEEAHHLCHRAVARAKETVMDQMLRQCRELGIGMVIVDQHPHLISSAALGNAFASICLNLRDPADVNRAAAFSGLREDEKRYLSMLPVGQGIVRLQDRWHQPFLVQFDETSVEKGIVTDDVFRAVISRNTSDSNVSTSQDPKIPRVRRIRFADPVSGDAFALVMDIVDHPSDGVRAHYLRLGWSMDRGNTIKNELLDTGLLEASVIPIGRTRKLILRPARQAREELGMAAGVGRESIEHEFWKRHWAARYRKAGYQVEIEASRVGGLVDVLAWRPLTRMEADSREGGLSTTDSAFDAVFVDQDQGVTAKNGFAERVGIEIKTGKSDVVRNVKSCLRSGFDQVVVVATNEKALEKVERELGGADLIVGGCVRIVNARASA